MKFLIVEDDCDTAEILRQKLASDAHAVDVAHDGADGSFLGRSYAYDAIVLDHSLPKKNGLSVCKEIRQAGRSTPIVFLSVIGDVETKLAAFEHGADDYVAKPFSLAELYARLQAITRRPSQVQDHFLRVHDVVLNTEQQTVTRNDAPIHLTRKEYCMLEYFMRHAGILISRTLLMEHVWSAESDPLSNTVEAHIRNLRKKLNAGGLPSLIINVPGRGYVMDAPENARKF